MVGIKAFFEANKLAVFASAFVLALLVVLGIYIAGHHAGKNGEVVEEQKREIQVQQQVGTANDASAKQRVEDAVKAERQRKELEDALNATNNPDQQRAIRGCVILREQGRDTYRIPACNRSPG